MACWPIASKPSLPVALDEITQMRRERDEVQAKIGGIKEVARSPLTLDQLEQNAREQIERLPELFNTQSIAQKRENLVRLVEKIEVDPNKKARLFGQPDLL